VLSSAPRDPEAEGPVVVDKEWDALVLAQRMPFPHVRWGLEAARFASAGIDVSDGLIQDLGHVCEASRVGASLESASLPVLEALLRWSQSPDAVRAHALTGGEDYVLAVTVPPSRVLAFEHHMSNVGSGAFPIGRVIAKRGVFVDGTPFRGTRGFQHFDARGERRPKRQRTPAIRATTE
jgi:thiamine-monophosphate kinase